MTLPETRGPGGQGPGAGSGASAREQIRQVREQVVDQARVTLRDARDRAGSGLAETRRQTADQIGGVATAFHRTSEHLRNEDQTSLAGLAETVGSQVDQVAGYLRDTDLRSMTRDLEGVARRQPAVVIGTAFAIGLLAARFLKSSPSGGKPGDEYGGFERIQPGGDPAGLGGFDATV